MRSYAESVLRDVLIFNVHLSISSELNDIRMLFIENSVWKNFLRFEFK